MSEIIFRVDGSAVNNEQLIAGDYAFPTRMFHSLQDYLAVKLGPELDTLFNVPAISALDGPEIPYLADGSGFTFLTKYPEWLILDDQGSPKIEAQKHIWLYRKLMRVAVSGLFESLLTQAESQEFLWTGENWAHQGLHCIDLEGAEQKEGLVYDQAQFVLDSAAAGIIDSRVLREEQRIVFRGYGLILHTVAEPKN